MVLNERIHASECLVGARVTYLHEKFEKWFEVYVLNINVISEDTEKHNIPLKEQSFITSNWTDKLYEQRHVNIGLVQDT